MNGDDKHDWEALFRRGLLVLAVVLWAASITLGWLIINRTIDQIKHPGFGLIVFTAQGLAITCTLLWGQFRVRRMAKDIFGSGLQSGIFVAQELAKRGITTSPADPPDGHP